MTMPVELGVGAGTTTNAKGREEGPTVGFFVGSLVEGVVVGRNVTGDLGVVGEAVPKNLNNK
jgi:hypothetical protein